MAWLEVHQGLREHRKLYACADELNVEPVLLLGTLVSLWLWALDNAQSGSLAGVSNRSIARAAKWPERKADKLVEALISNGWIDRDGDNLVLHDWNDYTGRLMDRRAADADRKRRARESRGRTRAGETAENNNVSAGHPADIHRTSAENPAPYSNSNSNRFISSGEDIKQPPTPSTSDGAEGEVHGPDGPAAPAIDYGAVMDLYNSLCPSLQRCTVLSEARKKAIGARIRSGRTMADFETVFAKAEASKFLRGGNDRNWTANFDWLIKDSSMAKVLDGNFDRSWTQDSPKDSPGSQTSNQFLRLLQEGQV